MDKERLPTLSILVKQHYEQAEAETVNGFLVELCQKIEHLEREHLWTKEYLGSEMNVRDHCINDLIKKNNKLQEELEGLKGECNE